MIASLERCGVQAGVHYPFPIHRLGAYRDRIVPTVSLTNSEQWADQCFSLLLYPELTEEQLERVATSVEKCVGE